MRHHAKAENETFATMVETTGRALTRKVGRVVASADERVTIVSAASTRCAFILLRACPSHATMRFCSSR